MTREAVRPSLTGGALTRSRILDAAARLMTSVGITRTTTKEIARAAGCSEAALYKHFRDKEEIFVRVLHERAPRLSDALAQLPTRAGEGEVAEHLEGVARVAVPFYRQSFPMAASLFASPELLAAHRRKLDLDGAGPHEATQHLAAYLVVEQRLGRVSPHIDPDAAASLLIGACFHRAFLALFYASDAPEGVLKPESEDDFAREIVHTVLNGIAGPGGRGTEDRKGCD
ncbi:MULTISPECIES: TetR/AcrR family transcriptional regulator [Streptomycetaceae]|uniref:TetR family transcriptional regulator n=1 Tax=Streptantibioticus cattleyicolor (strain ATCC 35852 / DSM 46488 / JCM 4925 / NBRC 14057 / NRRL 8057) TaxID=1003195 RepID=F8K1Q7_STREN|nr:MULTISPECIES: TetR/AcrR family transcriptional regulator [Streptomycetaceae]AEW92375.1 TetR family transcriptional regulator [Streptantibioticus cattleyicolor NRRL 8057 = DSM 46488]MYS57190.1 TetR family transcriptional regulator [Streptomyces sp. SID5468]CCB72741.1 putative TetR-family transcriptional regulator [Streptantibioticus cattleyicolor NRRL 8057 = DSM 46488]